MLPPDQEEIYAKLDRAHPQSVARLRTITGLSGDVLAMILHALKDREMIEYSHAGRGWVRTL